MHRMFTGILVLLVLYFAADHSRLKDRNRFLEETLAARAARLPRPAPAPLPEAVESPPPTASARTVEAPMGVPAPPPPAAALEPLVRAHAVLSDTLTVTENLARNVQGLIQFTAQNNPLDGLNLSMSQKAQVDAVMAGRERQIAAHYEAIQLARDMADLEILSVLSPSQQALYRLGKGEGIEVTTIRDSVAEPATAAPPAGFLGVQGADAPGGGVTFTGIFPDTAASGAGLLAGDVLLEFNDEKIPDYASLSTRIRAQPAGSPVNLKIRRNGVEFTQAVLLGVRR